MELQSLGDRNLRKLAFSHVVHSIRKMNQKHKNDAQNRSKYHVFDVTGLVFIFNLFLWVLIMLFLFEV